MADVHRLRRHISVLRHGESPNSLVRILGGKFSTWCDLKAPQGILAAFSHLLKHISTEYVTYTMYHVVPQINITVCSHNI